MRTAAVAMIAGLALLAAPAAAQDLLTEKKEFRLSAYTTVGGQPVRNLRIGYETYGTLSAARDNAVLIAHFFSGDSHAAGKYAATDAAPGYWDSIIGPGKAIDTDRYFVISSDSLVNLNAKSPTVITTGPASLDGAGRPYGFRFPTVSIRDFVHVQKALLDSLGIQRLHAVAGASMGALQAIEWAVTYPDMVPRAMAVIGTGEVDAFTIGWLNAWGAPIMLDPNWQGGDYYGATEPTAGLAAALKLVTLHARHPGWADRAFGRKWAAPDADPMKAMGNAFLIESTLDKAASDRARSSDANHFLYLVRANQLFLEGLGTPEEALARASARFLLVPAASDLLFPPVYSERLRDLLLKQGRAVDYVEIQGSGGHLDGVTAIAQAAPQIRRLLAE